MKRRLISVIAFAVLAALVSSAVLYKIISGGSHTARAATAPVLVATHELNAGALIGEADVRPVEWPVEDGTHWIVRRSDLVGRALLTPVAKDEPFAESRLAAKGTGAGLASRIPPGMRVVAVHVDELTGLSKFIQAGMHVDVISTGASVNQGAPGIVSRTILQNIEVFSTGDSDSKEKAAAPIFNLLVTPQQAEVLSQAVAQTRIQLVLRNPLDKDNFLSNVVPEVHLPTMPKPQTDMARAYSAPQPRPVEKKPVAAELPPPPPALPTIEIIHGTRRTVSAVAAASGPESQK